MEEAKKPTREDDAYCVTKVRVNPAACVKKKLLVQRWLPVESFRASSSYTEAAAKKLRGVERALLCISVNPSLHVSRKQEGIQISEVRSTMAHFMQIAYGVFADDFFRSSQYLPGPVR